MYIISIFVPIFVIPLKAFEFLPQRNLPPVKKPVPWLQFSLVCHSWPPRNSFTYRNKSKSLISWSWLWGWHRCSHPKDLITLCVCGVKYDLVLIIFTVFFFLLKHGHYYICINTYYFGLCIRNCAKDWRHGLFIFGKQTSNGASPWCLLLRMRKEQSGPRARMAGVTSTNVSFSRISPWYPSSGSASSRYGMSATKEGANQKWHINLLFHDWWTLLFPYPIFASRTALYDTLLFYNYNPKASTHII